MRTDVANLYVSLFGRAPERDGLGYWVQQMDAGQTIAEVAQSMYDTAPARATYPTYLTNEEIVGRFYSNVLGRTADAEGLAFWTAKLNEGASKGALIAEMIAAVQSYAGTDAAALASKALLANKVTVGLYYAVDLGGNDVAKASTVLQNVTSEAASVETAKTAAANGAGSTLNLTAGTDSLVGTAGNDLFIAGDLATGTTWNVGDAVNGGAGSDTLNVISGAAVSVPTGASLTSVETVSITSGATGSNVNGASWTGVEKLNVTAPAAVTVTGAATTAVSVTNAALAAAAVTVNGGSTVAVNTTSTGTGSTVGIGATTAAAGAVTVNTTTSMADTVGATTATGTAVTVTGGTSVTVNNTLTASTSDDVGDVLTGGAVIVNGNASTTSVSVTQTAAAARVTTGTTKAAVANGAVTVTDVNATSATAAGTIASVKLENFGAGSIDSSALTTVDLVGTATSLNIGRGNLTAVPTANTLTLNVAGVTMTGALTDTEATADDGFTTLNIVSSGTASTIASLASTDLTTINMSGTSNVTFTANTTAALTTVAVTGTGGLTLGTAIGANATFTGGAGNDGVVLSNAFTKAITMGAGADTVTYNGAASVVAGLVGSVDAGEGVDTIKMTAAQADAADGTAAFNTAFKGFEVLDVATGATATTINLAGINAVNSVVTRGVAAANTLTIDGFTSGGSLTLDAAAGDAASSRVTANVTNAVLTPADTFNVTLKNSTAGVVSFGAVELAGIETVNITTQDAGLLTNVAATIDAAVLVAVDATKVVVAGNNGLNLTNTGNVKVTTFDASGVIGNDATDTAANLAVTFASANTTATANEDVQKVGFQAIYCMSHVQPCFQFLA